MRIGYRYLRGIKTRDAPVFAYRVGPRGGVLEYLGGFDSLQDLQAWAEPGTKITELKEP